MKYRLLHIASLLVLGSCSWIFESSQKLSTVRVISVQEPASALMCLAAQEGYFHGLDLQLKFATSTEEVTSALNRMEAEVGVLDLSAFIQGLDFTSNLGILTQLYSGNMHTLALDLKGLALPSYLKRPGNSMTGEYVRKPFLYLSGKKGKKKENRRRLQLLSEGQSVYLLVSTRDYVQAHQSIMIEVLRGLFRAEEKLRKEEPETLAALKKCYPQFSQQALKGYVEAGSFDLLVTERMRFLYGELLPRDRVYPSFESVFFRHALSWVNEGRVLIP